MKLLDWTLRVVLAGTFVLASACAATTEKQCRKVATHKIRVLFKNAKIRNKEDTQRNHIADITKQCVDSPHRWSQSRMDCILAAQTKSAVRKCDL